MRLLTSILLVGASLTAAATAQTNVVFPSDHDLGGGNRREGYSWQGSFPFSWGVARQMALYESVDLNIPHNRVITHVGFPRDGNLQSLGHAVRMRIFMGQTARGVDTADRTFANNVDGAMVEVFPTQNFVLPDLGFVTPPPLIEEVWVPLTTPFVFDSARNLVVDYRIYANSNASRAFQYRLDLANFLSPVTSHGRGCANSAGTLPTLVSTPTAIGQNWVIRLTNGSGNAPVGLNIGIGLLQNPITIPGTNGLCDVYLGALASLGGTTTSSGTAAWSLPVPDDVNLNDFRLFSQAFMVDFFANSAGVVVTNADEIELGMRPRMARIHAQGDANAAQGSVQKNYGAVSLFRYQ